MIGKDLTVILVHGAWADGSSWSSVIKRLAKAGQRSVAVSLPLTTLADDVQALDGAIERAGGPVLLAAHAYGGAVIGAARSPAIRGMVFVAALAPDEQETVADVFYRLPPHALAPTIGPDNKGLIWLPDSAFGIAFAPEASDDERVVLAAVQRPITTACISVPVGVPLWREVPSWYLIAERDRMISAENQRFVAERMRAIVETHPVDHAPLVTAPMAVADLILRAAAA